MFRDVFDIRIAPQKPRNAARQDRQPLFAIRYSQFPRLYIASMNGRYVGPLLIAQNG
jgi:hypothetical protein